MSDVKLKRYNEALNDLDNCLSMEPDNTKAFLRKGDIFMRLQKKSEALAIFKEITKLSLDKTTFNFVENQVIQLTKELGLKSTIEPLNNLDNVIVEGLKKKIAEDDYSKLIIPKKITPSKSKKLVDSFKEMNKKSSGFDNNKKPDSKQITLIEEM